MHELVSHGGKAELQLVNARVFLTSNTQVNVFIVYLVSSKLAIEFGKQSEFSALIKIIRHE